MTRLRPFSDHKRGLFTSVDGPSGAGKSTLVRHLAQLLVAEGEDIHLTAEPCTGVIGALAYIPSGLLIQRFDGIDPAFLWKEHDAPDRLWLHPFGA